MPHVHQALSTSPKSRKNRKPRRPLPAPAASAKLLVRLRPEHVGQFRFFLEAWDNLAGFTVLDRKEALLKLFFSPHQAEDVKRALSAIGQDLPMEVTAWPQAALMPSTV